MKIMYDILCSLYVRRYFMFALCSSIFYVRLLLYLPVFMPGAMRLDLLSFFHIAASRVNLSPIRLEGRSKKNI